MYSGRKLPLSWRNLLSPYSRYNSKPHGKMVQIRGREEKDTEAVSGRWWPLKGLTLLWNSISLTLNIDVLRRVYCCWPKGSSVSSLPPWTLVTTGLAMCLYNLTVRVKETGCSELLAFIIAVLSHTPEDSSFWWVGHSD
jgi:hypothetical protein